MVWLIKLWRLFLSTFSSSMAVSQFHFVNLSVFLTSKRFQHKVLNKYCRIWLNYSSASAILLDTKVGSSFRGTGEPFDWKIVPETKLPLIVAGGLNPQNVFEAVSLIRPFAVDVSSGVEKASIKKDFEMIKEFVEQVGLADEAFNEKGRDSKSSKFSSIKRIIFG